MADLSGPPPPRYRVVERDRQLVVIDTAAGPVTGTGLDDANPIASWLPRQIQFDGAAVLTTHSVYDDRGPRTIRLDPGSAATVGRLKLVAIGAAFVAMIAAVAKPGLLLPLLVLTDRRVRTRLRGAVTRWLDRVEREGS